MTLEAQIENKQKFDSIVHSGQPILQYPTAAPPPWTTFGFEQARWDVRVQVRTEVHRIKVLYHDYSVRVHRNSNQLFSLTLSVILMISKKTDKPNLTSAVLAVLAVLGLLEEAFIEDSCEPSRLLMFRPLVPRLLPKAPPYSCAGALAPVLDTAEDRSPWCF